MIFKTDKDKNFFEMNPEALSLEFMPKCSSREAKWICLTYDYTTPLRNIPIEDRKEAAAKLAGFIMEHDTGRPDKNARNTISGKVEKVVEATKEFMTLQHDEEQELLKAYTEQLSQSIDMMMKKDKSEKEWGICDKINKNIPNLLAAKKELEVKLGMREEKESDYDNEPLSALDIYHEED